MDRQLYTLVVPTAGQDQNRQQGRQSLASTALIEDDGGSVEQVGSEPGDRTLQGGFSGRYAGRLAQELEELGDASGFDALPVAGVDGVTKMDGYYVVNEVSTEEVSSRTANAQRFSVSLSRKGTRNRHWRALETTQVQVDHDWGNDTTARVAVPTLASKVLWYDPETNTRDVATATSTRAAEGTDVDIYDLDDGRTALGLASDENPWLICEIDYGDEEIADVRVYDTLGNGSKTDSDGILQWQKLFSTQHDFADPVIVDSGVLRLELDEPNATINAETWDDANSTWNAVGLTNNSDWSLLDADLEHVAMARVDAQLLFEHPTEGIYALNATLARGDDAVLFSIPPNEPDQIPDGIYFWLEDIAATTIVDPQPAKQLVERREVRR